MIDLEFYKNKLLEKYKEKNDDEMYERYEHSLNVYKKLKKFDELRQRLLQKYRTKQENFERSI